MEFIPLFCCPAVLGCIPLLINGLKDLVEIPDVALFVFPVANLVFEREPFVEQILFDIAGCDGTNEIRLNSKNGWKIARLRYFNPVGAHKSGKIGESPEGIPNNLFPYISRIY